LGKTKEDFENLDLIYKNSSCSCESKVCQNCVFGKGGLGFYPQSKGNGISKPFSTVPEKQSVKRSIQPVVTCFYCMKKAH